MKMKDKISVKVESKSRDFTAFIFARIMIKPDQE